MLIIYPLHIYRYTFTDKHLLASHSFIMCYLLYTFIRLSFIVYLFMLYIVCLLICLFCV